MENCNIYSHQIDFDKVIQIIENILPKAKVAINDDGIRKSLLATIKGGLFGKTKVLKINYRQRENPSYKLDQIECGLTQNLMGMVNYIQSLPAKNEEVRSKFLYKVMAVNCEIAFMPEPEMTKEFEILLQKLVVELDGFIFAQPNRLFRKATGQHFLDKDFNLILDTNGNCEIEDIDVKVDVKYYDEPSENYTQEQLERKVRSESFLEEHQININKNLPCAPCSSKTQIRDIQQVIDRAYALLIIAAKGEGIEREHLEKAIAAKKIISFSPREKDIYESTSLSDQDRAYATWRYESLYTILWALGKMDQLKYPNEICDVQKIVGKLFHPSREEFEKGATLKNINDILEELDKTYRMNWACVDARIKGEKVTGDINPSIVYERHYALNWLTNYQNQDWDDIQTTT